MEILNLRDLSDELFEQVFDFLRKTAVPFCLVLLITVMKIESIRESKLVLLTFRFP